MVPYLGDFAEDATVYMPFNTFTSDDPSASSTITDLADGDIKVHKDNSATPISTDGATVAINFASITGNHLITVDTSAHSDYATGSDYLVRIEGTTVDGATINAFVGTFSIENRFNAAAVDLANGTDGLGAIKAETALIVADTGELQTDDVPGLIAALDTVVDRVEADTNELQGDWENGGRLDLLLDAIPTTAMRGTDSAATATNLATVDTVVGAIKTVTDQMVFTKANELDANTQSINGAAVTGDGNATPWDGA